MEEGKKTQLSEITPAKHGVEINKKMNRISRVKHGGGGSGIVLTLTHWFASLI